MQTYSIVGAFSFIVFVWIFGSCMHGYTSGYDRGRGGRDCGGFISFSTRVGGSRLIVLCRFYIDVSVGRCLLIGFCCGLRASTSTVRGLVVRASGRWGESFLVEDLLVFDWN